jgi:hypothetical protein
MPRNPDNDNDRSNDATQADEASKPSARPEDRQQDDAGIDRPSNSPQPSPEQANRARADDPAATGTQAARKDGADSVKTTSRSGQDERNTGSGG